MNEKLSHSFKSYINVSPKNNGEKNGAIQELKPKLLNGEQVVGAAHSVVMLTPLSDRDRGRFGSLFVTNYKLSFVPLENAHLEEYSQRNLLLGPYDVPLTAVGAIWLTDGGPSKRRRLQPFGDMPGKVKGLQVVCKNMKVLTFSFAYSPIGNGRKVTMALIHHSFPKRHDLLFAFEYRESYFPTLSPDINMFQRPNDWKRELERCGCPHWRITCMNGTSDAFMLGAGAALVVARSVLDCALLDTARHFRAGRVPVWSWGRRHGAALLRSAELLTTGAAAAAESILLEQVRRSHPKLSPPHVLYLCGNIVTNTSAPHSLPPLHHLQASYKKLVELCTPTTLQEFWVQDSQYYSLLDGSRWLRHVSSCLTFASEAASLICDNVTVLLQEGDGVDYCAVVSSLTQLILDPYFRTISGFQSLIQKEWIALGHPFCDRLGLPRPGSSVDTKDSPASQIAPVFLLFLDCTWQLIQQYPERFQFTETYLTSLWDSHHNHLFTTFLFNCPRDAELAVAKNFVQRPLWDWAEQFTDQDRAMFYNPLYTAANMSKMHTAQIDTNGDTDVNQVLTPGCGVSSLSVWSQNYERWLQPLDCTGAGPVHYQLHNVALLKQIQELEDKLNSLSILNNRRSTTDEKSEPSRPPVVSRFYPFSLNQNNVSDNLDSMQLSLIDASQLLDSQSLLNAPD